MTISANKSGCLTGTVFPKRKPVRLAITALASIVCHASAFSQTQGSNYIMTQEMLDSAGSFQVTTVEYFDGLGRLVETATGGLRTDGGFTWALKSYDSRGRLSDEWLPGAGSGDPEYIPAQAVADMSRASNSGDACPLASYSYDHLGRMTLETGPGYDWRQAGRSKSKSYGSNLAGSVKRYTAPLNDGALSQSGCYQAGALESVTSTDEDGRTTTVFTDIHGRDVLVRRASDNDTYFVYDAAGQLRFVLTPMYQADDDIGKYAYEYRYDSHGQCVYKRIPGCEPVYYWYDSEGRQSFMQDGPLRTAGRMRFYLYDSLFRLAVTGNCSSATQPSGESVVEFTGAANSVCSTGYVLQGQLQLVSPVLEEATYFDSYSFLSSYPFTQCQARAKLMKNNPGRSRGLPTGGITNTTDSVLTYNVVYYDLKGHVCDTRRTYPGGELLVSRATHTFTGKPLNLTHILDCGLESDTVTVTNTYSTSNGSLLATSVAYNRGAARMVSSLAYDSLGHVTSNTRPTVAGSVSYSYNLRGWMTSASSQTFNESLYYNSGGGTPMYGGDASSIIWDDGDGQTQRGYTFSYDNLGRLTSADYGEGAQLSANQGRYTEDGLCYTRNGAVTALCRYGKLNTAGYGLVDDLEITLDGDMVEEVSDAAVSLAWTNGFDFKAGSGGSYTYDGNGALLYDPDKNATFSYDLQGNLKKISVPSFDKLFIYDASGEKLETRYVSQAMPTSLSQLPTAGIMGGLNPFPGGGGGIDPPGGTLAPPLNTPRRYCGPFVTLGGTLERFLFDGGYLTFSGDSALFHYYITDHLGNVRAVVGESGTVEQRTHYYPFGGILGDLSTYPGVQPYKFGDKEYEHYGEIDLYDFGSRLYNPALCVWTSTDPLAEKYYGTSHHAYCMNNPINYFDPNGQEGIVISGSPGDHINREHFLVNGLDRAKNAKTHFKRKNETVTWIVYNDNVNGYDRKTLDKYKNMAKREGISMQIVSSVNDIIEYINKKDNNKRQNDRISSFYYLGHATPGDLDVGYKGTGEILNPSDFKKNAFESGAYINLVGGCRTAIDDTFLLFTIDKSNIKQFSEIVDKRSNIYGSDVRVYYSGGVVTDRQLVKKNNGKIIHINGIR